MIRDRREIVEKGKKKKKKGGQRRGKKEGRLRQFRRDTYFRPLTSSVRRKRKRKPGKGREGGKGRRGGGRGA